jgi:hypothetical protein
MRAVETCVVEYSPEKLMPVDLGVHLPIRGRRDMKLKPWIHSALHIGCVALLLLQGHYIWQLRGEVVEECAREISARERLRDTRLALGSMQVQLLEACEHPERRCVIK